MLPTRDPPQNKGHIQTESEGLEKDISHKWRPKDAWNDFSFIELTKARLMAQDVIYPGEGLMCLRKR